jgi:chorismate mutase/prephenate dehydratase
MDLLKPLREKIDRIDDQILALLNERANCAREVGQIKKTEGVGVRDPARELAIHDRLARQNKGPLPPEALRRLFREIISESRAVEEVMNESVKIAYLGPKATFTHMAATRYFGGGVESLPYPTIKAVFEEVERGRATFGVVPVENSSEGVVNHTLDLFADSPLKIYGEVIQDIAHHLLSVHGELDRIRCVYSHAHALAQCAHFLETQLPGVAAVAVESTAQAAEMARDDSNSAAIASELAARLYDLVIAKSHVQDHRHNATRFLIVSKLPNGRSGHDKTSLLFSIHDKVGGLYSILRPFSEHRVNLTKIESRPSKKQAWKYLFYVDVDGHLDDPEVQAALGEISPLAIETKILGSYPIADRQP